MSEPAHRRSLRWRLGALVLVLLVLLGVALAWGLSPIKNWLNIDQLVSLIQSYGQYFGQFVGLGVFVVAVSLAIPLSFLTLLAVVAYGPWAGGASAVLGGLIGATVSYGIGWWLGREAVERLGGPRLNMLSRQLGQNGLRAVIAIRLVPVAPFAIINMLAGASHIRLRDLMAGTAIGMLPMTLAVMFFTDKALAALKEPSATSVWLLAFGAFAVLALAWGLRRWLRDLR